MNHAITIGGLLLSLCIVAGIGCAAFGLLMIFAAGMSDASDDGTGGTGCVVLVSGCGLVAAGVLGFVL